MSAAATAAGYLYASGRLRNRGSRDPNEPERTPEKEAEKAAVPRRREVRVAAYHPEDKPAAPRRVPKVEYRTRRWKPE